MRDLRAWHGGTPNHADRTRYLPNVEFVGGGWAVLLQHLIAMFVLRLLVLPLCAVHLTNFYTTWLPYSQPRWVDSFCGLGEQGFILDPCSPNLPRDAYALLGPRAQALARGIVSDDIGDWLADDFAQVTRHSSEAF